MQNTPGWWLIINSICSALTGALIAHFSARYREKKNDTERSRKEIHGLLNTISFSLAMQYSQLYNLKRNLQDRLNILSDVSKMQQRDEAIQVFQDFSLDLSVIIKIEYISELLGLVTDCFSTYKVNPDVFHSCYLSNKIYHDIMNNLKNYNEMKRSLYNEENLPQSLVAFLKTNIPGYLVILDVKMPFIKRTQESLAELFTFLGKKSFQIDKPIKLWDA